MDGRSLAARLRADLVPQVSELGSVRLATVIVGDDPASHLYINLKHKAAREVGIEPLDHRLPGDTSEEQLLELVSRLNDDPTIDGVLPQLPMPEGIDEARVIRAVDPVKDVDGFHPFNAGQLYLGRPTYAPATPLGVMTLLGEYGVKLSGADAVVVGRSDIVGKPMAHLLLEQHATVTICHSRTKDLDGHTSRADVLVVAVGQPGLIRPAMVKQGATVVDVGQNKTDAGVVGDVDPAVGERAALLTPVPGGVGPMTIATLLRNTVRAALYRRGRLAFPG